MHISSPQRITADVRRLCRRIGELNEPVFVRVSAPPEGRLNDCFEDVGRQIKKYGGTIQHGWTIWEWPGIFIEGEFHAVWRDKHGELLDVTPKRDDEEQILFVPDPERVFTGQQIDNIRMPLGRDPRIKELLKTHEAYNRWLHKEMRAVPFGAPMVIEGEGLRLQQRAARLEIELLQSRAARRAVR